MESLKGELERIVTERVLPRVSRVERGWEKVGRGADGTPTMRVDEIAERAFLRGLEDRDLEVRVISEESGEVIVGEEPEATLVLDPLDGSHNASRGLPFYCVSIGLADPEAESLADVEDGLVISDLITFDSEGASEGRPRGRPTVAMYYYGTERLPTTLQRRFKLRCLGSVALELAMTCRGILDGFVDVRGSLRPTDVAGAFGLGRGNTAFLFFREGSELEPEDVLLRPDFRFELAAARDEELARELYDGLRRDVGLRRLQALFGRHPEGFDLHGLCGKLGEECAELAHAVGRGEGYEEEMADVLALVLNLANELEVDLLDALQRKFRRVFECREPRERSG
ncbi:MAG: inositol monophosphatase family protein [Euryarchaeota archaeon]